MGRIIDADLLIEELGKHDDFEKLYIAFFIGFIQGMPTVKTEQEWIPCSERLPEDNVPVNITWVNRKPEPYYAEIKDKPFTATGVYFRGKWYWYSATITDYLNEYGRSEWDEIEESTANCIEIVAWMPMPDPYEPKEGAKQK